ncbi:MAG: hypothetical protein AAF668_11110 [Pseudomonadota bacterium]
MTHLSRRSVVVSTLALAACSRGLSAHGAAPEVFICPPCGCSQDGTEFDTPGPCPDCDMTLMPKNEHQLGVEPRALKPRAGSFFMAGGVGKEDQLINVHYYLPDDFSSDSKILLIIPGAGRNSSDYRNAWLGFARKNNVLIAALGYPEEAYDLAAYHMGGVVKAFRATNIDRSTPGVIRARDEDIELETNPDSGEWLFNDFDRVFEFLKLATGSYTETYDIFGHSAGGQILHRMTLFQPSSKADRIVAANAGWYTLPDLTQDLPTGLLGSPVREEDLKRSFSSKLTILLGELDNSDAAGGTLLHTPKVDEQGLGRLSRGRTFYRIGKEQAAALGMPFDWTLTTVPNVGHDYRAMSLAAAQIVYD